MFAPDAQTLIDQAKDVTTSWGERQLNRQAIATSIAMDRRGAQFLAQGLTLEPEELRRRFPPPSVLQRCAGKLSLSQDVRAMLALAKALVTKAPMPSHSALIALPHLVGALVQSLSTTNHGGINPHDETQLLALLGEWIEESTRPPSLGELTERLRALRTALRQQVYGQEQAIQQFIDGLFNTEVVAAADTERRKPCGLFVFAGPPGVGKTFLAELGASALDRPFKRFDMSTYGQSHEAVSLAGSPSIYHGAQPGSLTDFVQRNPNAVLLFDEIEKAHPAALHLFRQILDAGRLQDKNTEQDVEFRDTIILFTTNVGQTLYDNPNAVGIHQAHATFHRSTILDALRSEIDPRTREPFFPSAICSRLATGYPILFNHLRVDDLAQIAQAELTRVGTLLGQRHGLRVMIANTIPLALVMREGAQTDARTIKAQAEAFLKEEVFKACQLFTDERVDTVLADIEQITVEIDAEHAGEAAAHLFGDSQRPEILFVGDSMLGHLYMEILPEVSWHVATSADQAFDVLTRQSVDFVILDLALQAQAPLSQLDQMAAFHDVSPLTSPDKTLLGFDHSPLAARRFAAGQQLLEHLHTRMPETPVFLFSLENDWDGRASGGVDEELLLACIRAGGARGVIRTALGGQEMDGWEAQRDTLRSEVARIAHRLRLEHMARELAGRSQVVRFDTAPTIQENERRLQIRCRNFRLVRAVHSADASALLTDAERPTTRFDDVIGATAAKEAISFLRNWLRAPKQYAAAGVEPPRGVLLTGPPGTGKTMLARALAGESDCAFLVEAATNFVTIWQGSGPQNVRDLFARARRYAPSIMFIDEIDAVGKKRGATSGAGRAEEETLNALLTEMDGFAQTPSRPVIVIAATNRVDQLDAALMRRFSRVIEVELPTRVEREQYLRQRLTAKAKQEVSPEMLERLAAQSQGLSIADMERVLAQAAVMALTNDGVITDALLSEAFEKVTLGEAKPGTDPMRTARHEAGHALTMCALGTPPIYVTIVGRGSFGGCAAFDDREERRSQTKRELEDQICQLLGGREAERLYYEQGEGDSTGPSNDLERATHIAEAMVYELGMAEEIGFVRIDRHWPLPAPLAERCHTVVRDILEAQSQRACQLLVKHRHALDRVVEALLDRNRLLKHELLNLIQETEAPGQLTDSPA